MAPERGPLTEECPRVGGEAVEGDKAQGVDLARPADAGSKRGTVAGYWASALRAYRPGRDHFAYL